MDCLLLQISRAKLHWLYFWLCVHVNIVLCVSSALPCFCAATGFGGTPQKSQALAKITPGARVLTVRFDANVSKDLQWRFEPELSKISLHAGETTTVYFKVTNLTDKQTSGQAAYNVSPDLAGAYFVKIACFCFEEKRLAPNEGAEWPVVFYLDPALESEEGMEE